MQINKLELDAPLCESFRDFLGTIDEDFTLARLRATLLSSRDKRLEHSREGRFIPYEWTNGNPSHGPWQANLEPWMRDQRNQMTGPADDKALVVKLINSGSPGVMLDLEDSMANKANNLLVGHQNILDALRGTLSYTKTSSTGETIEVTASPHSNKTVVWTRVRGLHVGQIIDGEREISASLFDLAMHFYSLDLDELPHPPCIYIPKSESAEEALWWNLVFRRIEETKGWGMGTIKCMALVESHPLAFEIEEFSYNLQFY